MRFSDTEVTGDLEGSCWGGVTGQRLVWREGRRIGRWGYGRDITGHLSRKCGQQGRRGARTFLRWESREDGQMPLERSRKRGSQIIEGGRILWILWVGGHPGGRWLQGQLCSGPLPGRGRCTPATCRSQMLPNP